jgi:YfiH family protein
VRCQAIDGLPTYHFDTLDHAALFHAVFTRLGGVSNGPFATLNVGSSVGDDPAAVAENHARVYARLGVTADRVSSARQVHGNQIAVVSDTGAGQIYPLTDGLLTATPGVALLLRFADCQPILLYDPVHHAIGLVHAGWRGVALSIAHRAVQRMQSAFGSDPSSLIACLGPAVGPCCYVVGDNVASAMGYALPNWRQAMKREENGWRLDLPGANAQQLAAAGVQHVEQAAMCTACRSQEFFSHRASGGRTGRFAVGAYLEARVETAVESRSSTEHRAPALHTSVRRREPQPRSLNPTGLPAFDELGDPARLSTGAAPREHSEEGV